MSERLVELKKMAEQFPDAAIAHFTLGKYHLDAKSYAEAIASFERAVAVDANYAAAWLMLGDARAMGGDRTGATAAYQTVLDSPHGRKDASLQADVEDRLNGLNEF